MGIAPHTPDPPALIFAVSKPVAFALPAYFSLICLKLGPTSALAGAWQARQLLAFASTVASAFTLNVLVGDALITGFSNLLITGVLVELVEVSVPRVAPNKRCCSAKLPLALRAYSGK
jgi:RsiW-degrading membrane proteinase PrsW (M82 family)